MLEQRKALEACDETYLLVARTAEALFRLGGEKELARRLRPKVKPRRKRPTIVQALTTKWCAMVTMFQRLRRFVTRSTETARNWIELRKALALQLARGSLKIPNV